MQKHRVQVVGIYLIVYHIFPHFLNPEQLLRTPKSSPAGKQFGSEAHQKAGLTDKLFGSDACQKAGLTDKLFESDACQKTGILSKVYKTDVWFVLNRIQKIAAKKCG